LAQQRSATLLSHLTVEKFKFEKIQDDGGRHLEKIEKSPYFGRILANFDRIWYDNVVRPLSCPSVKKFKF